MYAIAFDMTVDSLKKHYGEPYNNAYYEIEKELSSLGFERTQGSLYLTKEGEKDLLRKVYSAIERLKNIDWFKRSVRDIRVFKLEDWSDFTGEFKE